MYRTALRTPWSVQTVPGVAGVPGYIHPGSMALYVPRTGLPPSLTALYLTAAPQIRAFLGLYLTDPQLAEFS